jgi:hypothetical protein
MKSDYFITCTSCLTFGFSSIYDVNWSDQEKTIRVTIPGVSIQNGRW